jgi:hypothetical protein
MRTVVIPEIGATDHDASADDAIRRRKIRHPGGTTKGFTLVTVPPGVVVTLRGPVVA